MLGDPGLTSGADDEVASVLAHDRGELHVHINGAVPAQTILEIMADEATVLPQGFDFARDMVRLAPCQSLVEYLKPWQVLRLFPRKRQNLNCLAHAVAASLAENRVRFVELRSSVLYLTGLQSCSPAQALERLIESTEEAARHHGIRRGLILTVTRGDYGASNLSTLLQA
jgi:adenosine deaminase